MSNVHGLFSGRDDDSDDEDHANDRFVGGIGDHGGGSGLAVRPNTDDSANERDSVFQLAQNATSDDAGHIKRTITMYRDGFTVDDGPYRRLDDPTNADFLKALAKGMTPAELAAEGDVVLGLIDKRSVEYVEPFRSFSGQGRSLGSAASHTNNNSNATTAPSAIFDPTTLSEPPAWNESAPSTSIQVRLANGQRRVIRLNLSSTLHDLASYLRMDADGKPFRLVSGFPPKPLDDGNANVESLGLKGAQVSMQNA